MKEPNLREQFEKEGGMNQYTMGLQRVKKIRKATREFLPPTRKKAGSKCDKPPKSAIINNKGKWVCVGFLLLGAIPLSFNLPIVPFSVSFALFFIGHTGMGYLMFIQREYSLVIVNIFWCLMDVVGIVRWI